MPHLHRLTSCAIGVLVLVSLTVAGSGCGGSSGMKQPPGYGERARVESLPADSVEKKQDSSSVQSPVYGSEKEQRSRDLRNDHRKLVLGDPTSTFDEDWLQSPYQTGVPESVDSAAAIDDDIWRKMDLAEEYHAMGVVANREAAWEEAQYYFENALKVMASLDIETDSSDLPEAERYNTILNDIIADYRVSLRSLGNLDEDVSASVLIERFGDLVENLDDDTIVVYNREPHSITYDIPIVMNERVNASIVYFQTVAREAFTKYLTRSTKYAPLMKTIIADYGLPQDLIYLSLVESGYNPRAYSWARASGLWQFIASTGRLYNLNRSWWYDERRDPVKSTHAACRFLKELYAEFGSWELAMAAYNGGPGRVRRTIASQKTNDFWKMRLKRQTMDYVPLIMAATIIAKEPEKYGFVDIDYEPPLEWDEVLIDRCLDLSVVAREIGCSYNELKDLNPELLRKYTPPNTKKYRLNIPKGHTTKFWAVYEGIPSPKETSWVRHTIRRGETVGTIASKYGVSQYALLEANNLSRRSTIYAGKELIVPVPLDRDARPNQENRTYAAKNSIYTVRSGDTMWDIARAFGTTVGSLRRVNYIEEGSRIYVGQKLKIPGDASQPKDDQQSDGNSEVLYADNTTRQESSTPGSSKYRVRSGDTLWDIARRYGMTTSHLRQINGLGRSSRIYPGQVLAVSGSGDPDYLIHRVSRGETLSRIAQKYRTSITRIMAANEINDPDQLQVGDVLRIQMK
jgi:membrane-bound lytic murein transglycosylase D